LPDSDFFVIFQNFFFVAFKTSNFCDRRYPRAMHGELSDEDILASIGRIYIKRCTTGTLSTPSRQEWNGEHKIGFTKDVVANRNVHGQSASKPVDLVYWELPIADALGVEEQIHSSTSEFAQFNPLHNKTLTEFAVTAKETYRIPVQDPHHAGVFLTSMVQARIDRAMRSYIPPTITHDSLRQCAAASCFTTALSEPKRPGSCGGVPPAKRRNCDGYGNSEMPDELKAWATPVTDGDRQYAEMAVFIEAAVKQCPKKPPMAGSFPASDNTARQVGKMGIVILASFMKHTDWDGDNLATIKSDVGLKSLLDHTSKFEKLMFNSSGCGGGTGSQSLTWLKELEKDGLGITVKDAPEGRVSVCVAYKGDVREWLCEFTQV